MSDSVFLEYRFAWLFGNSGKIIYYNDNDPVDTNGWM